ncbi:MAG TPA: VWA domain-containing protein [candidate division Zixibacteria bacterium]|jgi:Ca-activated chloride channel family protein
MRFAAQHWLWGLMAVPILAVILAWAWRMRRRLAARFAEKALWTRLAPDVNYAVRGWKLTCGLLAIALMIFAVASPQWGASAVMLQRRGLDIVVALDVSRSMLASDVKPNRLDRAKREIVEIFNRLSGDRIGLVVFAGDAYVQFPLTIDAAAARMLLDAVDSRSAGRPGTILDVAIRKAVAMFETDERKFKVLVLISDGEGLEGDPLAAAREAAQTGVRIYTVGIGTPGGEPIPEFDDNGRQTGFKKDQSGQVVLSKLDEVTLQKIALATEGRYFRAGPAQMELDELFAELAKLEKKELEGRLFTEFEERYQYFLVPAFLLLGLEMALVERRRRRRTGTNA